MTTDFVRVPASVTVGDVLATVRALEETPDPLLAIYVASRRDPALGEGTHEQPAEAASIDAPSDDPMGEDLPYLLGIVRLRSLILADPTTPITDVMDVDMPTVEPDDPAEQAARVLAEYNLLAVPVLDQQRHMIGIVTVDDALAVLLPVVWQRRASRVFA